MDTLKCVIYGKVWTHWYKINGIWYHCLTTDDGCRYIDGKIQEN